MITSYINNMGNNNLGSGNVINSSISNDGSIMIEVVFLRPIIV